MDRTAKRIRYLVFLWIVYVALDSLGTAFRPFYGKKKFSAPAVHIFRGVSIFRGLVVFGIAVLNYVLIAYKSKSFN
jgi:hypothetical protein